MIRIRFSVQGFVMNSCGQAESLPAHSYSSQNACLYNVQTFWCFNPCNTRCIQGFQEEEQWMSSMANHWAEI